VAALVAGSFLAVTASLSSAADLEEGKATYKKSCLMCHGEIGDGNGPMGKLLKPPPPSFADADRMANRSDEELAKRIKEGKSPMPSYDGRLSVGQVQDVVAYIRTLVAK
jgi:mono/diheme cytochrome c family protein